MQHAEATLGNKPKKEALKIHDQHPILTYNFKNLLLEESQGEKNTIYKPMKVYKRDAQNLTNDSIQDRQNEKHKRDHINKISGFLAEPKESYKPLGDPILDLQDLILDGVHIVPPVIEFKKSSDHSIFHQEEKTTIDQQKTVYDTQPIDGYQLIKSEIRKSKHRWHAVKSGVEFSLSTQTESIVSEPIIEKSWPKIDPDKQSYFKNLYEIHKRNNQQTTRIESKHPLQFTLDKKKKKKPVHKELDRKDIESELGIIPLQESNNFIKFLEAKSELYEQRHFLNQVLEQDLTHLDYDRKADFNRRMKAFKFNESVLFVDAIKLMRKEAAGVRQKELHQITTLHPWFNEMVDKLMLNTRKNISPAEKRMVRFIQTWVEDQKSFGKDFFIRLMKMIPMNDFMLDDIQRILRFVKSHSDSITERDYFDAIDVAGHSTK